MKTRRRKLRDRLKLDRKASRHRFEAQVPAKQRHWNRPPVKAVGQNACFECVSDEDMRDLAADRHGSVTLADFLQIMAKREQDVVLQQKLMQAFAVFDKDGSGFISVNEDSDFRKQMTTLGNNPFTDEQFETFLSEYRAEAASQHPADQDGLVDYQEFVKLMLRKNA